MPFELINTVSSQPTLLARWNYIWKITTPVVTWSGITAHATVLYCTLHIAMQCNIMHYIVLHTERFNVIHCNILFCTMQCNILHTALYFTARCIFSWCTNNCIVLYIAECCEYSNIQIYSWIFLTNNIHIRIRSQKVTNNIHICIRNRLGLWLLFVFVFVQGKNYLLHSKLTRYSNTQSKVSFPSNI